MRTDYAPKLDHRRQWHYRRRLGPIAWVFIFMCFVWAAVIAWVFA